MVEKDDNPQDRVRGVFAVIERSEVPQTRANEFAVCGRVGKERVKVIVDSACHSSCVNIEVAKRLGARFDWNKPERKFKLANGESEIPVFGTFKVRLDMGAYSKTIPLSVTEISDDILLGVDWIGGFKKGELLLDGVTGEVFINKKMEVKLPPWTGSDGVDIVSPGQFRRIVKKDPGGSEYFLVMNRKVSAPKSTRAATELPKWGPQSKWILEEYGDLFPESLPPGLPPQRPTDLRIELLPEAPIVYRKQYRLSPPEAEDLKRQTTFHKDGERIQDSLSPYNAPSLMERKIGSTKLRWCVDYRGINLWTKKDPYPLPIAEQLIEKMQGAKVFSKIDFLHGYFQTRLHPDSVPLTAFSTDSEHFEFLVMPLGLKNAPASFMRMMNHVFKPLLGKCLVIFLDDLGVYSPDNETHERDLRAVLKRSFFFLRRILKNEKIEILIGDIGLHGVEILTPWQRKT